MSILEDDQRDSVRVERWRSHMPQTRIFCPPLAAATPTSPPFVDSSQEVEVSGTFCPAHRDPGGAAPTVLAPAGAAVSIQLGVS